MTEYIFEPAQCKHELQNNVNLYPCENKTINIPSRPTMIAICHALNMVPRLVGWDLTVLLTQIRSCRSCKLICHFSTRRYKQASDFLDKLYINVFRLISFE